MTTDSAVACRCSVAQKKGWRVVAPLLPAPMTVRTLVLQVCFFLCCGAAVAAGTEELPEQVRGETRSALDGAVQPLLAWAPESAATTPTPLFVFLHSWSSDFQQDNSKWLRACVKAQWIWLHPDFRGVNDKPQACGSPLARQDVVDAIRWAKARWNVDRGRIYLAGVSGGGHMALLMAGHHPDQFSAVSAWVGPTDLADWHAFHCPNGVPDRYAVMIEQSTGGRPQSTAAVDAEYRDRSPVYHLHRANELPVSIWTGVNDGHTGSVPVSHSLWAFNAIAGARGNMTIGEDEILQLVEQRRLRSPLASDSSAVVNLDREILLRRQAGASEIIVFDGGHESVPEAAIAWLAAHRREVRD